MSAHRVTKLIIIYCLALALIGCDGDGLKRALGDPPKEIFDVKTIERVDSGRLVSIVNDLPGEIQIIAYPDDPNTPGNEVTLDYARTGWDDKSEEEAAAEAEQNIAVTMQNEASGIEIHVKKSQNTNVSDHVALHVRVPPLTPLKIINTSGATVIMGEFNYIESETKQTGNIEVHGAIGKLSLKTANGNIVVDELSQLPGQPGSLDLETGHGDISMYAVGVSVKATANNGYVRFVGSLAAGRPSSFETKGSGNITLALPDDVSYTFDAIGGSKVVNDFASAMIVCGKAPPTGAFDFHSEGIPAQVGHIDVSYQTTVTHHLSGTLMVGPNNPYYLFSLSGGKVAKYIPETASPRQAGGALWTPECDKIDQGAQGQVSFQARAAPTGNIAIRLITKQR
jgi:hypothetical protein